MFLKDFPSDEPSEIVTIPKTEKQNKTKAKGV